MSLRHLRRSFTNYAARKLEPVSPADPKAKIPVIIDGKRVFPPVKDEHGNITYHFEFPADWKPYSFNYNKHGWLVGSQVLLWGLVLFYDVRMREQSEKARDR